MNDEAREKEIERTPAAHLLGQCGCDWGSSGERQHTHTHTRKRNWEINQDALFIDDYLKSKQYILGHSHAHPNDASE